MKFTVAKTKTTPGSGGSTSIFTIATTTLLAFQLGRYSTCSYYSSQYNFTHGTGTTFTKDQVQSSTDTLSTSPSLSKQPIIPNNDNIHNGNDDTTNFNQSIFALAYQESLEFFDDISQTEWQRIKDKVAAIYPNTYGHTPFSQLKLQRLRANRFFQEQFEPDFACRHERRIGRDGDGGKWVCDPHRIQQAKNCLVYSVGSNGDVSFEQAVQSQIGSHCEIHSFDMANYSQVVEQTGAHFHQWGISHEAMTNEKGLVYKTLEQTVEELGHVGRKIDIFKIDCEGCEWTTYPSFFNARVELHQILIELHASRPEKPDSPYRPMPPQAVNFFEAMYQNGYVIFHKEVNIRFWQFGQCIEYAFLKLHKNFFSDIVGNGANELLGKI